MQAKNVKLQLSEPIIYPITEGATTRQNFEETSSRILHLVRIASDLNVPLVQIREKGLPARLVYELARRSALAAGSKTKILVNDRADIALAARAHGVHLTKSSLPALVIREKFPSDFIIGVSAHSLEEAAEARRAEANFAVFSPIFATPSKASYGAPQGLEELRRVCERLDPFPIIALGGINEDNYESVLRSGARGIAAIRFLNDPDALPKIVEAIKSNHARRK